MAHWDEISAILALSIAIFSILPNLPFIKGLIISLLRHSHAPITRCAELLWEDVPDGVLHECPPATPWQVCKHKIVHVCQPKCWEQLLSVVFSRAWTDRGRQEKRVSKPEILPLSENFIHIDFRVLMAFVISTIGCNESLGSLLWGFSTYSEKEEFVFDAGGVERVETKVRGQYLIAHLFAERCRPWTLSDEKNVRSWTKAEIENLLNGYPPYYSATITLANRQTIAFPIHSVADIQKGGWILAVKLGNIRTALPLYFESQTSISSSRKATFQRATEWIREIIREPFTKAFPGDRNVRAALRAVESLCDGQEYIDCVLEDCDLQENLPNTLNGQDSTKAMEIFNRPTRMNTSQRAELRADAGPILIPLLSAAVFGVREVVRFEQNCINLKATLPPTLRPSSKIFVRDCTKTGFDASRRYPAVENRPAHSQAGFGW